MAYQCDALFNVCDNVGLRVVPGEGLQGRAAWGAAGSLNPRVPSTATSTAGVNMIFALPLPSPRNRDQYEKPGRDDLVTRVS
jgi:hypothetical protein